MTDPDPATTAAEDAAVLAAWHDYVREGWLQEGRWRTIRNDRVLRSELVFGAFCTAWTKARADERQRIRAGIRPDNAHPGTRIGGFGSDADRRHRTADLLETAWGVIANAGWDADDREVAGRSPGWHDAAVRWRDQYHAWLADLLDGDTP